MPFHEASSKEVREAVRVLQGRRGSTTPQAEQERMERLGRALTALGAGGVRMKRRVGGGLVVNFRDVPVEKLAALGEILRGEG